MISINNLTKKFGNNTILENTSYTFNKTGITCILGASGCGKTTLLNLLAGFDSNYSGDIFIDNENLNSFSSEELSSYRSEKIGFVFQNYNLLTGYTALENISIAKNNAVYDSSSILLERFNILEKANQKSENLSGGQKARVAISRALINNPEIILADEPTGALDRKNSNEIMDMLKEIAKDRLVIIITHDEKICEWADEIIKIEDKKIVVSLENTSKIGEPTSLIIAQGSKPNALKYSMKNFKVHLARYFVVILVIGFALSSFMMSLNSGELIKASINNFTKKNTAIQNGFVPITDNEQKVLKLLEKDKRIENIFPQYILSNIKLTVSNRTVDFKEKIPMPMSTVPMVYGVMPKPSEKKIAISPSVAKKLSPNVSGLIGKTLELSYKSKDNTQQKLPLMISGITNENYDNFFISSDIEKEIINKSNHSDLVAISYDVKNFNDVTSTHRDFEKNQLKPETAYKEVLNLQQAFDSLKKLFLIVSIFVLLTGLFIIVLLLIKLSSSRYSDIGVFMALGYKKASITKMLILENIILGIFSGISTFLFMTIIYLFCNLILGYCISYNLMYMAISLGISFILIVCTSYIINIRLITTEPAEALKK